MNSFFANVGKTLAQDLPSDVSNSHIYRVISTISEIELDKDLFSKAGKVCGPDDITPRDLKLYESASIDSLYKVFHTSVTSDFFPDKWKTATVSCIYKKRLETRLLRLQTDLSFEHSKQSCWMIHVQYWMTTLKPTTLFHLTSGVSTNNTQLRTSCSTWQKDGLTPWTTIK